MYVLILSGEYRGQRASVIQTKKEFGETLYMLSIYGEMIYNGNYTWFPSEFIQESKT